MIYNEDEFNTSYESIIQKLKTKTEYKKAFRTAFKDGKISKENFSKALSSYVASLYSFDSDFDRFMRNEKNVSEDVKKDSICLWEKPIVQPVILRLIFQD